VMLSLDDDWARRDLRLLVRDPATLSSHARALFDRLAQGAGAGSTSR